MLLEAFSATLAWTKESFLRLSGVRGEGHEDGPRSVSVCYLRQALALIFLMT